MFLSQLLPLSTVTIGRLTTALFSAIILSQLRKKCCCLLVSYNCTSLNTWEPLRRSIISFFCNAMTFKRKTGVNFDWKSKAFASHRRHNWVEQTNNKYFLQRNSDEGALQGERLDVTADSSLTVIARPTIRGRRATNIGIWIGYNEYYSVTFKNRKDNTSL